MLLYSCVYNRPLAPAFDSTFWSPNSDHLHLTGLCNTIATRHSALLKHALQIVTFDLNSSFDTPKLCFPSLTLVLVSSWPSTNTLSSCSKEFVKRGVASSLKYQTNPSAQPFVFYHRSQTYAVSSPLPLPPSHTTSAAALLPHCCFTP